MSGRLRRLALQLFPDLVDVGGDGTVVEVGPLRPHPLRGDAREVAGKRGEAPLVRVRGSTGQLQQLERDAGVEGRCCDLRATDLACRDPSSAEVDEELVHVKE